MMTDLKSSETNFPFSYQSEGMTSSDLPLSLPRSAWVSQVTYLRTLFRVKKRLDQIENLSSHFMK
jgi:hypothetical protein